MTKQYDSNGHEIPEDEQRYVKDHTVDTVLSEMLRQSHMTLVSVCLCALAMVLIIIASWYAAYSWGHINGRAELFNDAVYRGEIIYVRSPDGEIDGYFWADDLRERVEQ